MGTLRWRGLLDGVVTVAMAGLIGLLSWRTLKEPATETVSPLPPAVVPTELVSLEGAHFKGDTGAPWVLLMFEDFQCSACAVFERDAMPALLKDYVVPGRLRLAVHTIGMQARGPEAQVEASLGACAARQGKFWEFREAMFARPARVGESGASVFERVVGGEPSSCAEGVGESALPEAARQAGIIGTPHFLLGRPDGVGLRAIAVQRGIGQGDSWLRQWLEPFLK